MGERNLFRGDTWRPDEGKKKQDQEAMDLVNRSLRAAGIETEKPESEKKGVSFDASPQVIEKRMNAIDGGKLRGLIDSIEKDDNLFPDLQEVRDALRNAGKKQTKSAAPKTVSPAIEALMRQMGKVPPMTRHDSQPVLSPQGKLMKVLDSVSPEAREKLSEVLQQYAEAFPNMKK